MINTWTCVAVIRDGDPFQIRGINIWDHPWHRTGDTVDVKDPNYGHKYTEAVQEIRLPDITIQFMAFEFSNNVWGVYLKQVD